MSPLTFAGLAAASFTGYVNGESFQQDGLTTFNGYQYAAWWDTSGHVNLSRRVLGSAGWQTVRFTDYTTSSNDSHNVISIGISGEDGTIHLAFDMHTSRFRYRRSPLGVATDPGGATWSTAGFTKVQTALTAEPMAHVTYPQFTRTRSGILQMTIRTGTSGAGDQVLYEYRPAGWVYLGKFIDGTTAGNNAYLFGIEYDEADLLHTTWTVRETPDASTNHDLFYAVSHDRGRSWRDNDGAGIATTGSDPMPASSTRTRVATIAQNRGLINQESQVVDHAGNVHVLASHLPSASRSQPDFEVARRSAVLVHYWRDRASGQWHRQVLPARGVLSRGDIGVTSGDDLVVVTGNSSTRRLSVLTASRRSGWTDWTSRYTSARKYYSDPLLDHDRLRDTGTLSVFSPQVAGKVIDVLDWTVS